MALTADGYNEHGVAMCECGNKRPHAWEPGEWCGDRVIPVVVEAVAAALHDEQEYREPTGDQPEGWCPPGHDVHQDPPREPFLWEQMVAEGKYEGTQDEFRKDGRIALQAVIEHVGGGQGA